MDQNSTDGSDKRSWRERLGIGAGAAGKDLPRIADEFAPPDKAARPAVKPAPMAPRAGVKAAPPRVAADPEKLADKLKAQREAQEKLAEQRVQAAKQRAEIKPSENGTNGAKPKFSFAVEEPAAEAPKPAAKATLPVPPPPQPKPAPHAGAAASPTSPKPAAAMPQSTRPVAPPPVMTPPPLTPPRQPLGAERPVMPPRPAASPPPVMPPRSGQRYAPPAGGYVPGSGYGSQVPPYRPVDPASRGYSAGGYAPPPAYVPPVGGYNNQPRLPVPPARGSDYAAESFDTRSRHLRPPARPSVGYRDEYPDGDIFDDPRATRRATAGEYSQAYRDAEQGYEEDLPPSRGPWMPLMLLLLLAIIAGGAVWWLYQSGASKTATGGQSGQNAPVVEAPAQPAKVTPDPQTTEPANQPPKKLIYDRIVGDREVLGGDVIRSEEVPAQPGDQNLQGEDPAQGAVDPAAPAGQDDSAPLPIPPPPGENGADQQGALPGGKTDSQTQVSSAASASEAADSSLASTQKSDSQVAAAAPPADSGTGFMPIPGENPPAPGETPTASDAGAADAPAATASAQSEVIEDPAPAPPPKKKVATSKKPAPAKEKSLGSKPVVLVPPADGSEPVVEEQVASVNPSPDTGQSGGLYSGEGIADASAQPAAPVAPAVKKKRTLADLFRNNDDAPDASAPVAAAEPAPAPAPAPKPKAQPVPVQPAQVASAGGYVVQLASFPNQGDATKEYGRLKARHGATLSGLSPIISQATVAGSLRYRLAVGPMTTREQASAICTKLFAAGERDCLVRRQ